MYISWLVFKVGDIVLTSNDLRVRTEKMKMSRIAIIVKEHAGYEEGNNMFVALKNLADLNESLKDIRKVLVKKGIMKIVSLIFPSHLTI